jgi:hypothetical protein
MMKRRASKIIEPAAAGLLQRMTVLLFEIRHLGISAVTRSNARIQAGIRARRHRERDHAMDSPRHLAAPALLVQLAALRQRQPRRRRTALKRWTATVAALALTALLGAAYGGSGGLEPPLASEAARVYVTEPSAVTTYDSSIATASGAGYTATADMGAGTFAAKIKSPKGSVFAGIFQLKLINNTGLPVTIGAGALRAHFDGTYIHPVLPSQSTATTVSAQLGVSAAGAGIFTARGDHQVTFRYDPDGKVLSKSNIFNKVYEQNGAKVKVAFAKPSGLIMDLVMPRIVLGAGATLFLNLQLHANTQKGTVDFAATPATVRLTLPPGVTLDNDAAVPLDWVITTP